MQISSYVRGRRTARTAVALLVVAASVWLLRKPLTRIAGLALGASAIAFVAKPVAAWFEKRLSRPLASLAALAGLCGFAAAILWLVLPTVLRECVQLAQALPESIDEVAGWLRSASAAVQARLPWITLPELRLDGLAGFLPDIASGTIAVASGAAGAVSRLSLTLVLSYFFLCDRDQLLLRLELLVPQSRRGVAVRMAAAVARELRLYLRGQLTISAAVGALSAAGLALIGVHSALVLGGTVGLLNMIPYFGPFIGGAPAVLIALGDGWKKAALTVGALAVVQQLDASLISPRVMGSLTGFSPAAVLVAIYAGASLSGIVGMLIALPVLMSIRTVFRVFVQSCENI